MTEAKLDHVVPLVTVGVGVAPVNAVPYQLRVQVPLCADVPNGSVEVDEIAIPVSNPSAVVIYGKSKLVTQGLTVKSVVAVDVSAKRGIGALVDEVVTVLIGA